VSLWFRNVRLFVDQAEIFRAKLSDRDTSPCVPRPARKQKEKQIWKMAAQQQAGFARGGCAECRTRPGTSGRCRAGDAEKKKPATPVFRPRHSHKRELAVAGPSTSPHFRTAAGAASPTIPEKISLAASSARRFTPRRVQPFSWSKARTAAQGRGLSAGLPYGPPRPRTATTTFAMADRRLFAGAQAATLNGLP